MCRAGNTSPLAVLSLVLAAADAAAQGYTLRPGDVIVGDTGDWLVPDGAVRVLRPDGTVEILARGAAWTDIGGVAVDRDGAVLLSHAEAGAANGIYRLDPSTGAAERLNAAPLRDDYHFVRDGNGDLVVADGVMGLARVLEDGSVSYYSPPGGQWDVTIGVALDYDGSLVVAEAPYFGDPEPGAIFRVDGNGSRTLLARDPAYTPNPNGLALDRDGSFVFTNAYSP